MWRQRWCRCRCFVYGSLVRTVELSMFDWNLINPNRTFVALGQFREILAARDFWTALLNAGQYLVALVFVDVEPVLEAALLLLSVRGRGPAGVSLAGLHVDVGQHACGGDGLALDSESDPRGAQPSATGASGRSGPSWLLDPSFD
jgi:hypothetical protein